jgi:mersacidin/lichenicidin family type 2 lantibiotic
MSNEKIIKAWKSAEYRRKLSASQRASLPENPAGARILSDDELQQAAGGFLSLFWCDPKPAPAPAPAPAPDPDPADSTVWACTLSCCCSPCNTAPR